jgi:hypothetical protein
VTFGNLNEVGSGTPSSVKQGLTMTTARKRKTVNKVVKASITFYYYSDNNPVMKRMTEEEMLEYAKASCIDSIYGFVKYGGVNEVVEVEVVNE